MWMLCSGLRACTSNSRGALATCSRTNSGSRKTVLSSTFCPASRNSVERPVAHELDADLGDQPAPARVERGHRVLGEDLVARHRLRNIGPPATCRTVRRAILLDRAATRHPSLIMWNSGSTSVEHLTESDRAVAVSQRLGSAQRHPGGRPRRGPARPGGAGRRAGHLHRAQRGHRAGQVHDLAAAGRPGAHRLRRARRRRLLRRRPAVRAVRRPPRPVGRARPARPARPWRRSASAPARRSTSASPAAPASSRSPRSTRRYLLGARDWTGSTYPRTARRSARCSTPTGVLPVPAGRARAAHRPRPSTDAERRCGAELRNGSAAAATPSPTTSSRSG